MSDKKFAVRKVAKPEGKFTVTTLVFRTWKLMVSERLIG